MSQSFRWSDRPVWISHEESTNQTELYLKATGITGHFKFATLPYPNHTYQWILRDISIRSEARTWWLQNFESHQNFKKGNLPKPIAHTGYGITTEIN